MLVSQVFASPKCIPISCFMDLLHHMNMEHLSSAHVHLTDSFTLLGMDPMTDLAQNRPLPRDSTKHNLLILRRNGSQQWIAKFEDFSTISALLPFPKKQHFVHYQELDYFHGNETVLPKPGWSLVAIANGWVLIVMNSKRFVLFLRAAIIELS